MSTEIITTPSDVLELIPPYRTFACENDRSSIFTTSAKFEEFRALALRINSSKKLPLFSPSLSPEEINYRDFNLVMYYQIEPSGGVRYSVEAPIWKNGNIEIYIDRNVPKIRTLAMVCTVFTYKIRKDIPIIIFKTNEEITEIFNKSS